MRPPKYFFKTLLRFVISSAIILGPIELALLYWSEHYRIADVHFVAEEENGSTTWTYQPLFQGCELPPPQPFAFEFAMNCSKVVLLSFAFSYNPHKRRVTTFDMVLFFALTAYQVVIVPLSMGATIWHFATASGPFASWWQGYQCFGIMWLTAPFAFNTVFYGFKALMAFWEMMDSKQSDFGPRCNPLDELYGQVPLLDVESESLEHAKEVYRKAKYKWGALMLTFALSVVPFLIPCTPYLFTHVLPGMLIFAPVTLILVVVMLGIFYFTARDPQGDPFDIRAVLYPDIPAARFFRAANTVGGLFFIPAAMVLSIIFQTSMVQMTYLYNGEGWIFSIAATWLERRTYVYILSFKKKVMSYFWTMSDLLNEVF